MGKTHVAGGAMAWAVIAPLTGATWQQAVVALPVAALAGLGPDIDHRKSSLSRVMPPFAWLASKFTGHRRETHSILSTIVVWKVFGVLDPVTGAAVATGWGSHIVLDAVTREGVAWFWPLTREKTSLFFFLPYRFRLRTNGVSEMVFAGIMTVSFAAYMLARLIPGWP